VHQIQLDKDLNSNLPHGKVHFDRLHQKSKNLIEFLVRISADADTKVFWGMCSWLVFGDGEPLPPPANNNNNVNENEQRAAKKQKIGDNVAKTTKTDGIFGTFICLCSDT
jgi:hypothetical protein